MKYKQLKKNFVKKEIKRSVKQRPIAYLNLPKRTKLDIIYVDDYYDSYSKVKNNYTKKR